MSYGTLGPSLTVYGKDRKFDPAEVKQAYTKIYNSQAVVACSNMPRFGANKFLTRTADQGRRRRCCSIRNRRSTNSRQLDRSSLRGACGGSQWHQRLDAIIRSQ